MGRKPQSPRLNPRSPLYQGLGFFMPLGADLRVLKPRETSYGSRSTEGGVDVESVFAPGEGRIWDAVNGGIVTGYTQPALGVSDSFTWAIRVRPGESSTSPLIGNRYDGTASPLQFVKISSSSLEYYSGGLDATIANGLTVGQLYTLVVVKDGATLRYYEDGQLVGTDTVTQSMDPNPVYLAVGSSAGQEDALAELTWAGCWERALTAAEAKLLAEDPWSILESEEDTRTVVAFSPPARALGLAYRKTEKLPQQGLLAAHNFSERGGDVLHDSSGHGRNVARTGGTWQTPLGNWAGIRRNTTADILKVGEGSEWLPTDQVTALVRAKIDIAAYQALFGREEWGTGERICAACDPTTINFDFGGFTTGTTRVSVDFADLPVAESEWAIYVCTVGPRGMEIWQNLEVVASNTATPTRTNGANIDTWLGASETWNDGGSIIGGFAIWDRQLSEAEIRSVVAGWDQPEDIERPTVVASAAAGGGDAPAEVISGEGAVTAPVATVAGEGDWTEHSNIGTGAVTAPASTVAGTGEVVAVYGTGAVNAPAATVDGSGTSGVVVTGTGEVSAPVATVDGSGLVTITGTGAVVPAMVVVAGAGLMVENVTGTGAPAAPSALVVGSGTSVDNITGTGAVVSGAPTVSGEGLMSQDVTGTGAITAPAAVVDGVDDLTDAFRKGF